MSEPHSRTVRGTFDNPKTQQAIKSNNKPPQLGDPTSLKPEHDNKPLPSNDSAPDSGRADGAPTISDPYRKNEVTVGPDKRAKGNAGDDGDELPHSKKVRGTLSNKGGKRVNALQLGDPTSLKAETSDTKLDKAVEREGMDKGPKSKL